MFAADPRHRGDADALATLGLAVYRGLALELVTAPDEARLRRGYDRFLAALR